MRTLKLLLIFVGVISIADCHKPINNPVVTPTDYCSCVINGKGWDAGCSDPFSNCLSDEWSDQRKAFVLNCNNSANQVISIAIYDSTGLKNGTFILNKKLKVNTAQYRDYNMSYTYGYNTDSVFVGAITVKFDSTMPNSSYIYRVSGSFSFNAVYELSTDTVNVSDGKFSLRCHLD
jgi:hypothetical protein